MNLTSSLIKRLTIFFDSYRQKADFLKRLSHERKGADEIILLVCCYLDQLAGCLFPEGASTKRNFERLLLTHSGESDEFERISVADLGIDILYAAEIAGYIILKPGRLQLPREDFKPLIKFLDETGIALTEKRFRKLLLGLHSALKSRFRIHMSQTMNKNSYGCEEEIIEAVLTNSKIRGTGAKVTANNIKSLIKDYSYASVLYREYRCKAVHEAAGISVDKRRFWRSKRPYFTSEFLIACLETCIECVEKAVRGKGLLPLVIWSAICELDEFEFLDVDDIQDERPIRLKIE
jgi:hypothetical protein